MDNNPLKSVVEALLFAAEKPLTVDQVRKVIDGIDTAQARALIEELMNEYSQGARGMRIIEVAGGYRMITSPELSSYLKKMYRERSSEKLSKPALETLAIIAYKQPLTKLEVEALRNVNVDGVIKSLGEKMLIRVCGRKKVPGRPIVYGTTRQFLEYFGLKSLEDLPKVEELSAVSARIDTTTCAIDPIPEGLPEETNEPAQPQEKN